MNQIGDVIASKPMQDFDQYTMVFNKLFKCVKDDTNICIFTSEEVIMNNVTGLRSAHSANPPDLVHLQPPGVHLDVPVHQSYPHEVMVQVTNQPVTSAHHQP